MKRIWCYLFAFCLISPAKAQLTLESCQEKACNNYPLIRQYALIEKSQAYNLSNVQKGNLPQISLQGKASYQSDVTSLPFDFPGVPDELQPHDQYQAVINIQQNIWDGGNMQGRKKEITALSKERQAEIDVDMYALRERINQLYFGLLLLSEQIKQNKLLQEQLSHSLNQITAYCQNGIANQADIYAVKVEQIKTRQEAVTLRSKQDAYLRMLSLFIGESLTDKTQLEKPLASEPLSNEINRPELAWYSARQQRLFIQEQNLKNSFMPQFSLFAQGGYANPGLNMLQDKFQAYYIVGARLNWNFGALYSFKNDRRKIHTEQEMIRNQQETFLFNTRLQLTEQTSAIQALHQQMTEDDEMIRLQTHIRETAEVKVKNGTLSVIDMLQEITKESMAKQQKAVHEIQLLMNIYQQKHISNH